MKGILVCEKSISWIKWSEHMNILASQSTPISSHSQTAISIGVVLF